MRKNANCQIIFYNYYYSYNSITTMSQNINTILMSFITKSYNKTSSNSHENQSFNTTNQNSSNLITYQSSAIRCLCKISINLLKKFI